MDPIFARRSIRKYTSEPVGDDDVRYLLEAAMAAPSAGNQQPWHFVVIRDRATLDRIPEVHPYSRMLYEAPLAILVCGDERLEKHEGMWVQDCSAATQNILLAATTRGLGSVWLGVYPRKDRMSGIAQLVGLPDEITPFSLVAIGHPAEEKPPAHRYSEERVHYERW